MKTLYSFLPAFALLLAVHSLQATKQAKAIGSSQASLVAVEEETEVAHIERQFSQGANWTHPAPTTWSSRLEIRWNARWQTSPAYAV